MSDPKPPRVVGHRGAATYAPENTLASLREARRRGASWVEFDVKLSADGVPILMHDSTLRRTTGVDRAVATMPWSEIAELDAGAWFDRGFAGERVPSFEAAIACLEEQKLGANVEIKPCAIREAATAITIAETLRRSWPASLPTPILSSFRDAALAAARTAAPEFPRALLMSEIAPDWRKRALAVGAMGINTNGRNLTARQAEEIKGAGYLLGVYTINDPRLAELLVGMGADWVITDTPDAIIAAIGS